MDNLKDREYHFPKAVALVVFNRLDCAQAQMEILRRVTPPRFYIISDGPRKNVEGEEEKVNAVRAFIESNIDWECTVVKIYANENMGCDKRSISGYNLVFEQEEEAVLLEDDSVPNVDFYKFADKMLDYYRDATEVMMVAGFNTSSDIRDSGKDYFFSHFPLECAWGTWRRAWKLMGGWREKYKEWNDRTLYGIMPKRVANMMRGRILANYNGWTAWDSIWNFVMFYHNGYGVVSSENYVQNIGTGREDALHPGNYNRFLAPPYGVFTDNFSYRERIEWDKEYDTEQLKMRFGENCDKNWKRYYMRERLLRFAKAYFPKWLYCGISRAKRNM